MRPTLEEQETIIRIGRLEDRAEICTSDLRYMTKFDRLVKDNPEWEFLREETCEGDVVEKFYSCPVKLVSFRSKSAKVALTEEQRAERAERMRQVRAARNTP